LPETTTAEGNNGGGGPSITGSGTNSTTTGTLRHRKNRPAPQPPQRPSSHNGAISAPEQLEIRAPSELFFGVPSSLKTQWRHQPKTLVTGCVTYVANVSAFVFLAKRAPCFSQVAAMRNFRGELFLLEMRACHFEYSEYSVVIIAEVLVPPVRWHVYSRSVGPVENTSSFCF